MPHLDRENYVQAAHRRFFDHLETREVLQQASSTRTGKESNQSKDSKGSDQNRDNDDPNGAGFENPADQFEPGELREKFDGWTLYKKNRISFAPVRRYQLMVD